MASGFNLDLLDNPNKPHEKWDRDYVLYKEFNIDLTNPSADDEDSHSFISVPEKFVPEEFRTSVAEIYRDLSARKKQK